MQKILPLLAIVLALAVALPLGASAADDDTATATLEADGVQRLTVKMDSYAYAPRHIIVQAGHPVELTLVNESGFVPHDFVIDDPASGLAVQQNAGGGKTVKVTFTPEKPGSFAFFCSKKAPFMASHREKGMEGTLEVRPASP